MPATRPITGEVADPTAAEDSKEEALYNTPFTMRYDKLIIAVGAYSQSEKQIFLIPFSSIMLMETNSIQYPWRERTRTLPQGRQRRPSDSESDPRMYIFFNFPIVYVLFRLFI